MCLSDISGRRATSANKTYGLSSSLFTIRIAAVIRVYEAGASHGAERRPFRDLTERTELGIVYRRKSRALAKWHHKISENTVRGSKNTTDEYMWSHHVTESARVFTAPGRSWVRDWGVTDG